MLYWAITIVVALILIFRRPRSRGVRLRLLGGARASRALTTTDDDETPSPAQIRQEAPPPAERRLNVVFQFNGESWDAYEVLGLPAGSNYESVKAAYLESLDSVDQSSRPFVEAAFRAISDAQRG
jgi:hypothetical protein